jgi:hypothetical protein
MEGSTILRVLFFGKLVESWYKYWYLVQFPLGEDFAETNLLWKASTNGIGV